MKFRIRALLLFFTAALVLTVGAGLLVACGTLETRGTPLTTTARAVPFELPDQEGSTVSLASLLERGPAVVIFYRGHW